MEVCAVLLDPSRGGWCTTPSVFSREREQVHDGPLCSSDFTGQAHALWQERGEVVQVVENSLGCCKTSYRNCARQQKRQT